MKFWSFLLVSFLMFGVEGEVNEIWFDDYSKAMERAQTEEKPVLLVFSGSDWCKPCIRLDQQVFQTETFQSFAKENLVLLKADFPRKKKNRLSEAQTTHNEQLAEKYNPNGFFPYVLLLNENGTTQKILQTDVNNATQFIQQLK